MNIFLLCEIKSCLYAYRNDSLEKLKSNYIGYSATVGTTCLSVLELIQLFKKRGGGGKGQL